MFLDKTFTRLVNG